MNNTYMDDQRRPSRGQSLATYGMGPPSIVTPHCSELRTHLFVQFRGHGACLCGTTETIVFCDNLLDVGIHGYDFFLWYGQHCSGKIYRMYSRHTLSRLMSRMQSATLRPTPMNFSSSVRAAAVSKFLSVMSHSSDGSEDVLGFHLAP